MKTYRAKNGPFRERVYYEFSEIETICLDALQKVDLLPTKAEPIRIERFINKRFGLDPTYDDLPEGLLGFTLFGANGPQEVVISRTLAEEHSQIAERRINTTLAHEAGHGLLHAHLFALGLNQASLIPVPAEPKVMCRGEAIFGPAQKERQGTYKGEWWEFQANQAMGALLLPRPLVQQTLSNLLSPQGTFSKMVLPPDTREQAARMLAETFDVNPAVARIRIAEMYPAAVTGQLTL